MVRARRASLIIVLSMGLSALVACGEPPDKEMQQAQGAIDAARAAGAARYAAAEFTAATEALQRAHEAAKARDYRLALNHALDSRERAQNAAREAADNKATTRVAADRSLSSAGDALAALRAQIADLEVRKTPAKVLAGPRQALEGAERHLQEAREALERGDFVAATTAADAASGVMADIQPTLGSISAPSPRRSR